ncbi:hypothetical protein BDR22DRAFT_833708 [Usnea florida]
MERGLLLSRSLFLLIYGESCGDQRSWGVYGDCWIERQAIGSELGSHCALISFPKRYIAGIVSRSRPHSFYSDPPLRSCCVDNPPLQSTCA